jgi:methylphosphotriester-DNA--protein-cysteine methyltransferase
VPHKKFGMFCALRCVARGPTAQGRAFETVLYAALKAALSPSMRLKRHAQRLKAENRSSTLVEVRVVGSRRKAAQG